MSEKQTVVRTVEAVYEDGRAVPYLVVLAGNQVGRTLCLDKSPIVLGRSPKCHFILDEDGVSRKHAEFDADGEGGITLRDLGSTNGTFVNGVRVNDRAVALRDGDRIQVGSSIVLKYTLQDDLEDQYQLQQYRLAVGDHVTGLYNRKYLHDRLEHEMPFYKRHERPLSLLLLDVQEFDHVVQRWGSGAGDLLLRSVASRLRNDVRAGDVFARVQGPVLAVLLRESGSEEAEGFAARLVEQAASSPVDVYGNQVEVCLHWSLVTVDPERHISSRELMYDATQRLGATREEGVENGN